MLQKVNLHATDKKLERKKKNCSLLFTLACLIFSRPPQQTPSNSPEASADCATYSATELKMMKRAISQGVYIYIFSIQYQFVVMKHRLQKSKVIILLIVLVFK